MAKGLLTLRVRTIYSRSTRTSSFASSNRLRLFHLSRLYAEALDRLRAETKVHDLYGGLTTFHQLAAQARDLLEEKRPVGSHPPPLTPAETDIVHRIALTCERVVHEVFYPRRRAWILSTQQAEGDALDDKVVELPDRQTEPEADGPLSFSRRSGGRTRRAMTLASIRDARRERVAPSAPPPDAGASTGRRTEPLVPSDDDDDDDFGPLSFATMGEDMVGHGDEEGEFEAPSDDWLRELFAANAYWDNELFSDGSTSVEGMRAELLPPELLETHRYPVLTLSPHLEQELAVALELGTDIVALETSMSLSGDITTTISPDIPLEQRDLYLAIHRDSMRNALDYWTSIIQALQAFLTSLADAAFGSSGSSS